MIHRIAVDFDNTLIAKEEDGSYSAVDGAPEAMRALREAGFEIIIHTCRTGIASKQRTLAQEIQFIESVLQHFEIVYDEIYLGEKLVADAYIDDRAISFEGDWSKTIQATFSYFETLEYEMDLTG